MRARTTWNTEQILQRTSATNRVADPYAMNQDHIKPQPPADKYLTGDPSAFAEDITTPDNWKVEYSGGAVKRDEIGLPEDRPETFNHPEKTASLNHEAVLKKAHLATQIARRMLSANATEVAIEEQATSLMHLPDQEIVNTYNRLAGELPPALKEHMEKKKEEGGQQAAKKEESGQDQAEQEQAKQAAAALQRGDARAFQAALSTLADLRNKRKANDPQQAPMQQQAQGQQQQAPAQQQAGQQQQGQSQQQAGQDQQSAWYDTKAPRPGHPGPDTGPYAGQQQQAGGMGQQQGLPPGQAGQQQFPGGQQWGDGGQQAQQQQMPPAQAQQQQMPPQMAQVPQQNIEAEVQQMIQQAAQQLDKQANGQQQQAPVQQAGQQQQAQGQPQQQAPAQQQAQQQVQQAPAQQQAGQQQQAGGLTNPSQGISPNYAAQQQTQAVQASVVVSDDQLIDQMLMGPGGAAATPAGAPIAEMDIQMEAPNMDIGDVTFEPGEDAMLRQLFATGDEAMAAQQAQEAQQGQGQQTQANVRTAALRTIGTRPMGGVARIGGAGAPPSRGQEVDKLTSLWQSAPDVREAFGLKTNS